MNRYLPNNSTFIWVVGGIAGILGLIHIVEIVIISIYDVILPGGYYLGYLSSAILTIGLLYGSYRVHESELLQNRDKRIIGWFLSGMVGFLLLNIGFMSAFPPESWFQRISWSRWAIGFGGGIGFAIGVFEARAMSREVEAERVRLRQEELQKERDRLDTFASFVSHDLRNPLNVAQGRLTMAQAECESEDLDAVERSLTRMENMISDMLTLARTGEDIEETQEIDPDSLVNNCWESVDTTDATLNIDLERTIYGDEDRLSRVFENLIRNAVEHGGKDVTITVGELENGFFFEDDGQGISERNLANVFESGFSTSETGTGFGLAIVKQIIVAHDWQIEVTQGDEGGVRFEITGIENIAE